MDDICKISIPKTIKSAVKNLPVMITELVYKREGVRYKVCSKHGHITGTFSRFKVAYRRNYNKDITKIDLSSEGFKEKLSLQQACQEFSNITGCNCVTDCSLASRCSCKVAGIPCTTICHKGRGKINFARYSRTYAALMKMRRRRKRRTSKRRRKRRNPVMKTTHK